MSPRQKKNFSDKNRVVESIELNDNMLNDTGNQNISSPDIIVDNEGVEIISRADGEVAVLSPISSNVIVAIDADEVDAEEIKPESEESIAPEESRVQVRRLSAPKAENKLNKFDNFFIKLWSFIVSAVFGIASGINFVISKIFKRRAPDKYVRAVVAVILIISIVLLFTLPFRISISQEVPVDIYGDGLIAVKTRVYLDDKGYPVYKWGYANKKGKIIIQPVYDDAMPFMHGVAWVKYSERIEVNGVVSYDTYWHLIDKRGKRRGDLNFSNSIELGIDKCPVGNFTKDVKLAWVYISGLYGYIGTSGNIKIDHKYQYAEDFSEGLARVRMGNTEFYINNKGKKVGDDNFDQVKTFQGGLGAVQKYGVWGFVNSKGKMVIEPSYKDVSSFVGDYAAVRKGNTYGIIDKKGNDVVKQLEYVDINTVSPEFRELIKSLHDKA